MNKDYICPCCKAFSANIVKMLDNSYQCWFCGKKDMKKVEVFMVITDEYLAKAEQS